VAPLVEAPLLEAPPQESSSSRTNQGTRLVNYHKDLVPFGGLKTPNPWREVKSVLIHIYSLTLHELFFPLAYLLFYISIALEKKTKNLLHHGP
jgi:hypothetical protein